MGLFPRLVLLCVAWVQIQECSSFDIPVTTGANNRGRVAVGPLLSLSGGGDLQRPRPLDRRIPSTRIAADSNSHNAATAPKRWLYKANASTKWVVTLAQCLAMYSRPHSYHGPYIALGSMVAVYLTAALKQVIHHDRPAGSPFRDPGMPSSHSLVSFFLAVAWMSALPEHYSTIIYHTLLGSAAAVIAWLRVVCGYHSWAQIGVGAALGTVLGKVWWVAGQGLHGAIVPSPRQTLIAAWTTHTLASLFFLFRTMRHWVGEEKYL